MELSSSLLTAPFRHATKKSYRTAWRERHRDMVERQRRWAGSKHFLHVYSKASVRSVQHREFRCSPAHGHCKSMHRMTCLTACCSCRWAQSPPTVERWRSSTASPQCTTVSASSACRTASAISAQASSSFCGASKFCLLCEFNNTCGISESAPENIS